MKNKRKWYSLDVKLRTKKHDAITFAEAKKLVRQYIQNQSLKIDSAEEAVSKSLFGFLGLKDSFLELAIDSSDVFRIKFEGTVNSTFLSKKVKSLYQKEYKLKNENDLIEIVKAFFEKDIQSFKEYFDGLKYPIAKISGRKSSKADLQDPAPKSKIMKIIKPWFGLLLIISSGIWALLISVNLYSFILSPDHFQLTYKVGANTWLSTVMTAFLIVYVLTSRIKRLAILDILSFIVLIYFFFSILFSIKDLETLHSVNHSNIVGIALGGILAIPAVKYARRRGLLK